MTSFAFNDPLDPNSLGNGPLRRAVRIYPECESTNDEARKLAEAGEPEGLVILADYQTAGRGRMGRAWRAPRGSSLLFSLLLRPPPASARQAMMAVSLGVMGGIARVCGLRVRLKWPNDILIRGKKAGGMLCDLGWNGPAPAYAIVGTGLNVNFDPRGVEGIPPAATSVQSELGRPQPRAELLRAILEEIEPRYRVIQRGGSLREEWLRALDTIGRTVRVALPEGEQIGTAVTVDAAGALVLELCDGRSRTIPAGDVVHLTMDDGKNDGRPS